MNIVATRATRILARQILAETEFCGGEAVLRHLPNLDPKQVAALIALLAKAATTGEFPTLAGVGQPRKAILLTEVERRRAHARYVSGQRDRATVRGEREYQREHKRRRRADLIAVEAESGVTA